MSLSLFGRGDNGGRAGGFFGGAGGFFGRGVIGGGEVMEGWLEFFFGGCVGNGGLAWA